MWSTADRLTLRTRNTRELFLGAEVKAGRERGRVVSIVRHEGEVTRVGVRCGDWTYGLAPDEVGVLRKVSGPTFRPLWCPACLGGRHRECRAVDCQCRHRS